jgi:Peptidase A4 family
VYCAVQYVSNRTAWQVVFANQTTGQYFMLTLAPSPQAAFSGNTAEWIMEAPDFGLPTSSLPIFTPVVFTTANCCGPNKTTGNPAGGGIWNIVGSGI